MKRTAVIRALLPLLLLLVGIICAAPPNRPSQALDGVEIYRRSLSGVAWIEAPGSGKGTGWLLDRSRRLLITCCHVVGDCKTIEVFFPVRDAGVAVSDRGYYLRNREELRLNGHLVMGRVLERRPTADLALVELESLPKGVDALPLAATSAQPGDRVHVVGCRYDVDSLWCYGGGEVRQVLTLRDGYYHAGKQLARGARVLLASAPINEGDSGGPLFNGRGQVIGMCAALAGEAKGDGYFVDVEEIRPLLRERSIAPTPTEEQGAGRDLYSRSVRSLALARNPDSGKQATAWLVDRRRRLLLTSAEIAGTRETVELIFPLFDRGRVVAEARVYRDRARLKEQGALTVGCVLARDARRNLALLEAAALPSGVDELFLAQDAPQPGEALHLLGCPEKIEALWLYTAGWLRQRAHANLGQTPDGPDPAVLVVQAPLSEGEGGGPVLDGRGRLVAVVSGKAGPQQQISYCLDAEEVRAFLTEHRAQTRPQTAAELLERGRLFTQARLFERAILDFTEALKLDPACARACSERGGAHLLQGDAAAAVRDCTRALELDPKLAAAHVHRAAARLAGADAKAALADCDRAVALDPRNAPAFSLRALARLRLGDAERARADCEEALWLDPKLATPYFHRGLVAVGTGDHEAARRDYDQAVRLDPRLADAFQARAELNWQRGDVKAALADYDRALDLKPNTAAALHGRAQALLARGEQKRALDDYRACISLQRRLLGDVLNEIERHAAQLVEKGELDSAAAWGQAALQALRPAFREQPELDRIIEQALAEAERESDVGRKAERLRKALADLRQ
jgi:tetratricopeptide (TPR) repeat protein